MSDNIINETIRKLSGNRPGKNEVFVTVATVDSVNLESRTCVVTTVSNDAETTIEDVMLMAAVDDGLLLVPAIDSTVVVSYGTFTQAYITLYSEIERVVLVANSASLELTNGSIILNSGEFGGLVKINELVSKLNNLESLVNDLISKYNTHTHAGVTSGSSLSGITAMIEPGSLTPTIVDDLENKKVTHGN